MLWWRSNPYRLRYTQLCCWVTPYILYTVSGVTSVYFIKCIASRIASAGRYRCGRLARISSPGKKHVNRLLPLSASCWRCRQWRDCNDRDANALSANPCPRAAHCPLTARVASSSRGTYRHRQPSLRAWRVPCRGLIRRKL